MQIPGKDIAEAMKLQLSVRVKRLEGKNIIPHLAVIIVGDDPSSVAYVRQKKKVGEEIGAIVSIYTLPAGTTKEEIVTVVDGLNRDKDVHGIIIQRPVPLPLPNELYDLLVRPEKDVDGFHPTSPFSPPIANAVMRILEWVHREESQNESKKISIDTNLQPTTHLSAEALLDRRSHSGEGGAKEDNAQPFFPWLREQRIVIIGRGATGGLPIARILKRHDVLFTVAHRGTEDIESLCRSADIIISCVGRSNVVRHQWVSEKTVLIGVGLHQEEGKLIPDYDQEEVSATAAYYTPVPGGVGPVNVACLLENVILAAENPAKDAE